MKKLEREKMNLYAVYLHSICDVDEYHHYNFKDDGFIPLQRTRFDKHKTLKEQIPNSSKRLVTECFLINENKDIVSYGASILMPKDHFSRKRANHISLERAKKALRKQQFSISRFGILKYGSNLGKDLFNQVIELLSKVKIDKKLAVIV
jgi:hypothetical protein